MKHALGTIKSKTVLGICTVVSMALIAGWAFAAETSSNDKEASGAAIDATALEVLEPYMATYTATVGEEALDKDGYSVKDANGMLAAVHAQYGVTCEDCHQMELDGIVALVMPEDGEAHEGDYTLAELIQIIEGETTSKPEKVSADAFCMREGCHVNSDGTPMTRLDLCELTADTNRNPHEMPHGQVECDTCHKAHVASTTYCSQCHNTATVPDGWLTTAKFNKLVKQKAADAAKASEDSGNK